jgi:hypothetical protein
MSRKSNHKTTARYKADIRQVERNRAYYHAHKHELLKRYKNKFIAINDDRVVDIDSDRSRLLDRMFQTYGDLPFFFTQVTDHPRVVRIPSYALRKSTDRK